MKLLTCVDELKLVYKLSDKAAMVKAKLLNDVFMTSSSPTMAYMKAYPYPYPIPPYPYFMTSSSPTMAYMTVIDIDATVDNMTSHGCIL